MATMLPNRKLEKLAALGTKPESTPASPTPHDMTMAIASSACPSKRLRTSSTAPAAARHATTEPATGSTPAMSPPATPASEECESASPIIDRRFKTTMTPIQGMAAPSTIPATNAWFMNAYSNMPSILHPHRRALFDDAVVQAGDPVEQIGHPREVVGDQQRRRAGLLRDARDEPRQ